MMLYRDAWGVPHLRADSANELAFAQGHNAALDRAWQIEVERHRFRGTTAAFLGPEAVGWDRFARQARLDDTAGRCLRTLDREDPDTATWLRHYVDGVNAGLAEGASRSPEFAATGLTPGHWEPWTPLGIWLSTHILFAGFPTKLWREEVARRLGEDWTGLFATDGPGTAGSNGWLVPSDRTVTGAAVLAGDPHRFIEAPGVYQQIRLACPEFDVIGLAVPGVPGIAHFGHTGHVAWSITNAMADYQDLYAERLRRDGGEEGADGGGADGANASAPDHSLGAGDLCGAVDFSGTVEALGPDGWRPVTRHVETIEVAGADPVRVAVLETERGPVIIPPAPSPATTPSPSPASASDPATDGGGHALAVSLRYPPRVREDLGFTVLPALLRAKSVADVDRALDRWVEPVNVVHAADTAGGTLHRVAGAVPLRHPGNRLRVAPAWEADRAWRGWHHPMPRDTVRGPAVMANQRGIASPLAVEFAPPHRAERIRFLLDRQALWSAGDMAAIHRDTRLSSAEPLLRLLAGLDRADGHGDGHHRDGHSNSRGDDPADGGDGTGPTSAPGPAPASAAAPVSSLASAPGASEPTTGRLSPAAAGLRDRLLRWDRHMDADSTDAAAFATVRARVVRRLAEHPVLAPLAAPPPHPDVFQPWLTLVPRVAFALETLLTSDRIPVADRIEAVRRAVEETAGEEAGATGPPRRWGDLHRLAPWQALPEPAPGRRAGDSDTTAEPVPAAPDTAPDIRPALSGDHDCVLATSSVPGLTHHSARASAARFVWDLARREDSRWIVPLGASGIPGHPHRSDQLPLWVRGDLVPVVTDWSLLTPEPAGGGPAGPDPAGPDPADPDRSGSDRSGPDRSGPDPAGPDGAPADRLGAGDSARVPPGSYDTGPVLLGVEPADPIHRADTVPPEARHP
ncbi:penicillin acylase family protein [Streptomyces sp. WAC 00631]|uniref:penicillin acylase family protein n=1 Tax=Streptomyces sp. WAC 00631 TaxID=2203201 RepID=UPI001E45249F|nr:penicillin acylase family protein [Streptomyces sp. WAC 00631]MCC5036177.1 penicillin acylase family protein [Streptomyces sp. WAC 00631]